MLGFGWSASMKHKSAYRSVIHQRSVKLLIGHGKKRSPFPPRSLQPRYMTLLDVDSVITYSIRGERPRPA